MIYIIGYPKSGNTWLSYLVSYSLNMVYDDMNAPGVHPRRESIRKQVKGGHSHKSYTPSFGQVFKTHRLLDNLKAEDRVIYIVRDPRDVIISYYYYLNNSSNGSIEMSSVIDKVLKEWAEHLSFYKNVPNTSFIKYEDLLQNSLNALNNLFETMEIAVDENVLKSAIEIFSFENMSGRKAGIEDKESFFRKGVIGDWKNYIDENEITRIKSKVGDLMKIFDYT
jgi:hypothetical protein